MALPNYFKIHIFNNTGVNLDFDGADTLVITGIPWRHDTDGRIEYGSKVTLMSNPAADVADQAMSEGVEIDNSSDEWEGMFCIAELAAVTNSPDGTIEIYVECSEGDNAADDYPSDAAHFDAARMKYDLILCGMLIPQGAADKAISTNFTLCF